MLIEKAIEDRYEYRGFIPSLNALFEHTDVNQIVIDTICLLAVLLSNFMLAGVPQSSWQSCIPINVHDAAK